MINLIFVALGGTIGSSLRYLSANILNYFFPNIPLATLFVNFFGSFLIGVLISFLERGEGYDSFIKYFLIIGFLGSYTTFSAFSYEVLDLLNNKKFLLSFLYIITSVVTCVFAVFIGYNINKV